MMRRAGLAVLILLVILSGCKPRKTDSPGINLLTLKGPSAMGMIYMIDSPGKIIPGKLNIEILDEPMLVRARLLKEEPELAVLPLNMAAILYNKGLPYQVIAIPVWGTLYLFGSDTAVKSWPDLQGKRLFLMGRGTTPDILVRYLLKLNGLNPDEDVLLDYSFPTHIDLANAVSAGHAPLAVISEPLVSLARARNPAIIQIIDLNAEWAKAFPGNPAMPQTALIGRRDFIRDHPDWITSICDSWSQSIDLVNRHPALAARMIVLHDILPDERIAENSIPGSNLKFSFASDIRPAIDQYLQVFYTFNPDAVGGRLPDEQFICEKQDH